MTYLREHARRSVRLIGGQPAIVVAIPDVAVPKDGPDSPYRLEDLSSHGLSPDEFVLKRETYAAHAASSARQRPFTATLPKGTTARVAETNYRMRADAAASASSLLAAARAARDEDAATDEDAAATTVIGVASAYRSADAQFSRWDELFGKYWTGYREKVLGNPKASPRAVDPRELARFIGQRLAAPGYSKHQTGVAIDFKTVQAGKRFGAGNGTGWLRTWFHGWLVTGASQFGFRPLKGEPWHWDFEA